jgi:diguanylate cyclase
MDFNSLDQYSTEQQVNEIEKEYTRIDNDWLSLHYKISVGMVLFAFIVECIIGVIMMNSDMLTTTIQRFILKFIIIPSGINILLVGINTAVMKSKHILLKYKIYMNSLSFVAICFVLFTAHNAFTATYYIFTVSIVLTAIYASYRITCITAVASLSALVISELFIQWDVDKISVYDSTLRLGDFLIAIFILLAFSIVCMVLIRYEQKKNMASIQLQIERQHLQQSLQVDELTGIMNRKALMQVMKDMEDGKDYNYILAIADIDNFKGMNDTWGHPFGDHCLKEFSRILVEHSKKAVAYRFGGDEFCLLFHNAEMEEAVSTCKQIQLKLAEVHMEEESMLKLTVSFGLAAFTDQMDATELLVRSDRALYEAKIERNNLCVSKKTGK